MCTVCVSLFGNVIFRKVVDSPEFLIVGIDCNILHFSPKKSICFYFFYERINFPSFWIVSSCVHGKNRKGKAKIPTDDLIPKTRHGRNQHSLAFQIPSASKDVYMYSFFPHTIRDWNDLPESLISSSELNCQMIAYLSSPLL